MCFSPDGRLLATLIRDEKRNSMHLALMPADGGEPRELLEFEGDAHTMGLDGFCWGSDSREMIFLKRIKTSDREQPNQFRNELWLLSADTGASRKLGDLPNVAGGISLNPNGRSLVFGSNISKSEI
jgi:Tol biopolymer transport system component